MKRPLLLALMFCAVSLLLTGLYTHWASGTTTVSLGAGVKWQIAKSLQFRLEVHDYLTQFPKQVIAPNTGTKLDGWLNNIVPMVGISYLF
mgnify:CR=1 FL=1